MGTLAPAAQAVADICYQPSGVVATYCAERDSVETFVARCETLNPQYLCGAALELAHDEVFAVLQIALDCVGDYYLSPCDTAWDKEATLLQDAQHCASLQTQYLCGAVVDEVKSTVLPIVDNAIRNTENCASLQPQYLCGTLLSEALSAVQSVLTLAESCAGGTNQYCATVLQEVAATEAALQKCVSMTPGTLCPSTIQLVLQELDSLESTASGLVTFGVTPGLTDDPNDLVIDPVQYATKVADMEQQTTVIDTDLVEFATQPAPSESEVPPTPDGGTIPPRAKVAVTGYAQGDHNWCVPASTATTLTAFGFSPSLSVLVDEEKSKADPDYKVGTYLSKAATALRRRMSRPYYVRDNSKGPHDLMHMVSFDIGRQAAPVIIGTSPKALDWWPKTATFDSENTFSHAVTIYLYHTSSGGGFKLYDSAYDSRHAISLADMSAANQADPAGSGELVW